MVPRLLSEQDAAGPFLIWISAELAALILAEGLRGIDAQNARAGNGAGDCGLLGAQGSFDEGTTRGYTALQRAGAAMFVIFRAITYATLFVGFLLIYLPARVLESAGIVRPPVIAAPQIAGIIVGSVGAAIALWCVFTFATIGKGTPAPFDPPRKLVIRGPYRFVRNPMYIGAGLALAGAALFYKSSPLLAYAAAFLFVCHLFVLAYEEPTLRRSFGADYEAYCQRVRRWWPPARAVH